MKTALKIKFAEMPETYAALVAMYPPRPLHDRIDEQNVEEIIMEMAGHKLAKDQEDYLDLLSDLLKKFHDDRARSKSRRMTPAQRLVYLLQESKTSAAELSRILKCSQPLVSLLINGKRELSKANIELLAAHFKLNAGYFL